MGQSSVFTYGLNVVCFHIQSVTVLRVAMVRIKIFKCTRKNLYIIGINLAKGLFVPPKDSLHAHDTWLLQTSGSDLIFPKLSRP